MKAAQHTSYNKNNINLNLVDIDKPQISDNQVLLRVKAAGLNPLDNMISRGQVKMIVPYKLPQTAGNEVVGVVEELGSRVSNFKLGDRVFARLPLDHIHHQIYLLIPPSCLRHLQYILAPHQHLFQ